MKSKTPSSAIEIISELNLKQVPTGQISCYWLKIISNGIGQSIRIPIMIAKGTTKGKVLGITAVIHGDELNGVPVIQRLFSQIDPSKLKGTIIGVPGANISAMLRQQRRFDDNEDLNRIFPGKEIGTASQMYAYRFLNRIVKNFNYHLDLHTASYGRINPYYIRADLSREITSHLSHLLNPQIILHKPADLGNLRYSAEQLGIHSITVELGNPALYQEHLIEANLVGIGNVISHLGMWEKPIIQPEKPVLVCQRSHWFHTDKGGLLETFHQPTDRIAKGDLIGRIRNLFGKTIAEYQAPFDGIMIGKSINPISQTGARVMHLGVE
ncbi:MAG: peptidase M14 [Bacteroidetes bacterium]|nr:MAG: peptidase M14 [Bacteroidota bacterium]